METPDKYTLRVHLKTPNTLFPQNVAEPVTLIFSREVLEEDGDLKKRLIGTGPYILKEHTRKVRVVLQRNPDYWDKGRPYVDEHGILGWGVPYIYYQDTPPTVKDLGPWWQYRPADAKKLLAEAGHPNGFETTLFYYEYFPQMTSEVQLVQHDLKKNLNINVKITKLDYTTYYGRYVESKWDGMSWGF